MDHLPDPNEQHELGGKGQVKEEYLHPCCQKELTASRIRNRVVSKLQAADRARIALDRRRNAVGSLGVEHLALLHHRHEHGSGCCSLTRDYPALGQLRATRCQQENEESEQEGNEVVLGNYARHKEYESELETDSDDELLAELESDMHQFLEIQRAEMARRAEEAEALRRLGIGIHTAVRVEDVLRLVHLRSTMVCHLFDAQSDLCAALDLSLEDLAARYPGTRFVRSEARAAGALLERLRVQGVQGSAVVALKDGCLVDVCRDLRRFGREREAQVHLDVLEQWMRHCDVLKREAPPLAYAGERDGVQGAGEGGEADEEEEEVEVEYFDCGVSGCNKVFSHSHVGLADVPIPTEFGAA